MAGENSASKAKSTVKTAPEKGNSKVTEEQLVYARLLNILMKIGLVAIIMTFLVYFTGIMAPKLAINDVINNWSDAPQASTKADSSNTKAISANTSAGVSAKAGGEANKKTAYDILLEENGIQHGWTWVKLYNYGDFLNLFPIAFLASITIFCYLAIVPVLFRKGDTLYGTLAIIEVLILVGAASGIISGGGH